jgi:hypothetical protein
MAGYEAKKQALILQHRVSTCSSKGFNIIHRDINMEILLEYANGTNNIKHQPQKKTLIKQTNTRLFTFSFHYSASNEV